MTLYIWGVDVFENVFRRAQIEARLNASIAMGSAFFGNADSSYRSGNARRAAGAVSTTDYDRQSDVAPAYARWVRLRIRRELFALWPLLPLHPKRYSTDHAHACDYVAIWWFYGLIVSSDIRN